MKIGVKKVLLYAGSRNVPTLKQSTDQYPRPRPFLWSSGTETRSGLSDIR